jgi:hypothetical protein
MALENLDQVLRNCDKAKTVIQKAIKVGMGKGLSETTTHTKQHYVFSVYGRGFNDDTGNLRNSIDDEVLEEGDNIVGIEYASMEYAPYVELRWEGAHAFLYPGVMDKEDDILDEIKDAVQTAISVL